MNPAFLPDVTPGNLAAWAQIGALFLIVARNAKSGGIIASTVAAHDKRLEALEKSDREQVQLLATIGAQMENVAATQERTVARLDELERRMNRLSPG